MAQDSRPPASQSKLRHIAELGPAWISAIGGLIVALTGAGFFVGHATAKPAVLPQQTVTVVKTVTISPSPADSLQASATSSTNTGVGAAGTQLGSYSVNLGFGHSIPLGAAKPVQADFSTSGLGDLGTAAPADHLVFVPINGNKMLSLPGGTTPTFQACANDTVFAGQADSAPGTSFCLIETGKIAGVIIASAQPSYVVLNVTVWQNAS